MKSFLHASFLIGFGLALPICAVAHDIQDSFPKNTAPDARIILPSPPSPGSSAQADDDQVFRATRKLQNTPRWYLAQRDAELDSVHLVDDFSCAVGFKLDVKQAPHLEHLLHMMDKTVEHRTSEAKHYWHRARPFVGTDLPVCTSKEGLGFHSSYPSGHTTAGYGMALVLAHIYPERAAEILQRGRIFGESRIVCGVHWKTDVEAGFLNASAQMDVLLSRPEIQDDLTQARQEVLAMKNQAISPDAGECAVQADAAAHSLLSQY
ncbi:acid phosphatase [Swingsia samuiensis]|uniref:Acid phosphatase n=1 Tax=Swingsia samuiensis TaxID=1293412 RepID=A0A4Y6UKC2_9PROT|nr:phosphatase PAP2 family protein [Swingsia samuiensis]QDH17240.1 phosphatase PAP2 family protein [Swingsia samuiensis]